MFAVDAGPVPEPDPFLAERLEAVARDLAPAVRAFLGALAASVRTTGRPEAGDAGLDAAGRGGVLVALAAAHDAARVSGDPLAGRLLRLRAEWETHAAHGPG